MKIDDVPSGEGFWAAGKQCFLMDPGGFQGNIAPSGGTKGPPIGHVEIFLTSLKQIPV